MKEILSSITYGYGSSVPRMELNFPFLLLASLVAPTPQGGGSGDLDSRGGEKDRGPPRDPDVLIQIGDALNSSGQGSEAEQVYLQALASADEILRDNCSDPFALMSKGTALSKMGDYRGALIEYWQAVDISPEGSLSKEMALVQVGESLLLLGNDGEALEAFREALEIDPLNPRSWKGKAMALHAMGFEARADTCITMAEILEGGNKQEWEDDRIGY